MDKIGTVYSSSKYILRTGLLFNFFSKVTLFFCPGMPFSDNRIFAIFETEFSTSNISNTSVPNIVVRDNHFNAPNYPRGNYHDKVPLDFKVNLQILGYLKN